ncbi:hypothetical protein, partial [Raoultella ornithinolytica]|uniref:hypothetical protein n=1 Tax=Raoultella ornithinolytica TaxID=54291 RepID=UPI0039B52DC0
KRAYCLKTQPATGETYPKSDLFNKAPLSLKKLYRWINSNKFKAMSTKQELNIKKTIARKG